MKPAKTAAIKKQSPKKPAPKKLDELTRFVVLPSRGLHAIAVGQQGFFEAMSNQLNAPGNALMSFESPGASGMPKPKLRVLDSISGSASAKLVEMKPEDITALRIQDPGVRIVPEVFYKTCEVAQMTIKTKINTVAAAVAVSTTVEIVSANAGVATKGATVVAFTDFAQ